MKRAVLMTLLLGSIMCLSSGCYIMKIVTVPMRIVGGVVSIVPVVGNKGHDIIDSAAETVEDPF